MDQTDEALVQRVQAGERDAFGVLLERYEAKLLRYGSKFLSNSQDIEDIVQDAFINAYKNIQSFDTDQKFSPWMYRIAHNALVNALKKKSRSPILSFDFDTLLSHAFADESVETEREQKEVRQMIDQSLADIPPKYREVLILHYLEDLSYKEIAEVVRVPIGTVGIRIKRGKEMLKNVVTSKNYGRP